MCKVLSYLLYHTYMYNKIKNWVILWKTNQIIPEIHVSLPLHGNPNLQNPSSEESPRWLIHRRQNEQQERVARLRPEQTHPTGSRDLKYWCPRRYFRPYISRKKSSRCAEGVEGGTSGAERTNAGTVARPRPGSSSYGSFAWVIINVPRGTKDDFLSRGEPTTTTPRGFLTVRRPRFMTARRSLRRASANSRRVHPRDEKAERTMDQRLLHWPKGTHA